MKIRNHRFGEIQTMNVHHSILILLVLTLTAALPIRAEVFSLWPFSPGAKNTAADPEEILAPAQMWTEKITVDGHDLHLGMALVNHSLKECYDVLKKHFPNASFAVNQNSMLMEQKKASGMRRRVFLLAIQGIYPVIQFSMELPAERLKGADWPKEFPLPPGAKILTSMRFPERKAVYGAFSTGFDLRQTLPSLAAALKADGWKPLSGEHSDSAAGTGEVFLKTGPDRLLIIGLQPEKNGGCTGSLYMRPLK